MYYEANYIEIKEVIKIIEKAEENNEISVKAAENLIFKILQSTDPNKYKHYKTFRND